MPSIQGSMSIINIIIIITMNCANVVADNLSRNNFIGNMPQMIFVLSLFYPGFIDRYIYLTYCSF